MADADAELTHLSNEILVAIRDRQRATLDASLHADFVQIDEAGKRTPRQAFIAAVVSSTFQIVEISFEWLSVDVFGEEGVVCGVQKARVRLASGGEVTGRSAFTDVFVRRDGRWQLRVATSAELA